ncbi:hypothetical protein [Streptomyces daliensis]|uniref:Uncharacterized protein n=1 Tax=Streptomyces daliensis TaxID=299421 RepID=A0A8T4IJX4_9ACTN|nr:hypothetical protein [Streptomyces daliensis]
MPQIRALSKGARITGGVFALLFALQTWSWVVYDIANLGFGTCWDMWAGAVSAGGGPHLEAMPATTATDLGLGLLQLAAVFAAFTGAWTSGGLLTVMAVLTFSYRLPVIWHAGAHTRSTPFYVFPRFFGDSSLDVAMATSALSTLLTPVLFIVLLAGIRPWPAPPRPTALVGPDGLPVQTAQEPEPPLPSESPQHPTGPGAAVAGGYLAVLCAFSLGWCVYLLIDTDFQTWLSLLTGEHALFALLDVAPVWDWLTLAPLCAVGALLAMTRRVSARGYSLGVALASLPVALLALWGLVDRGALFTLGEEGQIASLFTKLELFLTVVGGIALIVLAVRPGVAARPGAPLQAGPMGPMGPMPMGAPGPMGPAPMGGPGQAGAPPFPQQQPPQPYFPPQQPPAAPPQGGGFGPPPPGA